MASQAETGEVNLATRIVLLEQIVKLQKQLQDSRDEVYELRRDGDARIEALQGEVKRWQRRHDEVSRLGGWLLASLALSLAIAVAGWARVWGWK